MIKFKSGTNAAALSYAAITSDPVEELIYTESQAAGDSRFLFRALMAVAICWGITLGAFLAVII